MTSRIGLFETDYPDPDARSRFYHELLDRVASGPRVASAALAMQLPGTGQGRTPLEIEGQRYNDPDARPRTGFTAGPDRPATSRPSASGSSKGGGSTGRSRSAEVSRSPW
jgi:hypothetical protein